MSDPLSQTRWKNRATKEIVVYLYQVKISSPIEGKWFNGIAYRDKDQIYIRNKEDFFAKFLRIEND